jgi:hypothetical protein
VAAWTLLAASVGILPSALFADGAELAMVLAVVAVGIGLALACALVPWESISPAWFFTVPAAATLLVGVLAAAVDLAYGVLYIPLVAWAGAFAGSWGVAAQLALVGALMAAPLASDPGSWRTTIQIGLLLGPLVAGTALAVARIRAAQDSRVRDWDEFATEALVSRIRAWAEDVSVESRRLAEPGGPRLVARARLAFAATAVAIPVTAAGLALGAGVIPRSNPAEVPVVRATTTATEAQRASEATGQSSVADAQSGRPPSAPSDDASTSGARPDGASGGEGDGGARVAASDAGPSLSNTAQPDSADSAAPPNPATASAAGTPPASDDSFAGGAAELPEAAATPPGHGGTPLGHGGTPPGLGGATPPGHGGAPPGHGGGPPAGPPPAGQSAPPGQSGGTPPGHGGTPPRQGATPPGNGGH